MLSDENRGVRSQNSSFVALAPWEQTSLVAGILGSWMEWVRTKVRSGARNLWLMLWFCRKHFGIVALGRKGLEGLFCFVGWMSKRLSDFAGKSEIRMSKFETNFKA
jgi:hypothetical protein